MESLPAYLLEHSGQDTLTCYQCQKCTVGCPVAAHMDIKPNAVHRMIQYGRLDVLLKSPSIWVCAGCETCGVRCPNGIDTGKVFDALKQLALKKGVRGSEKKIPAMHTAFINGVRRNGRMHELSLIGEIRMKTGGYFQDMQLGIKMFRMGKLNLFPERVKNMGKLKKLFKNSGGSA